MKRTKVCNHDNGFYVDVRMVYQQFYDADGNPIGTSGTITEFPNAAYCKNCDMEIGVAEVDEQNHATLIGYIGGEVME